MIGTDKVQSKAVADVRGAQGMCPKFWTKNFFIFMQFSGKIGEIISWWPPSVVGKPPPEKS